MSLPIWILIFVGALVVLLKASDWFIAAAEKIGLSLGIPAFIVGVTIVAAGTSLPELVTSIYSVLENSSEIVVGNVVGSNITNILLVLGLTAIVGKKIIIDFDIMNIDMPLFVGSAFLLYFCIYDNHFSKLEALICLIGLFIFLAYTFGADKEEKDEDAEDVTLDWKVFVTLLLGAIGIKFGAEWTVKSIIEISNQLNIAKEAIALSAVAFGTSLPEIIVSVKAARKGKPEIAIGNVLGSNIFNTFAVMGIPGLLGVLAIPENVTQFSLPLMMAASFLFLIMMITKKISNWEGYILILFYVIFIGELFL